MKVSKSFTVDGLKARQYGLVESQTEEGAVYRIDVKFSPRKLKQCVVDRSSPWSRRSDYQPVKDAFDFYQAHFERRCSCEHDCCGHYFTSLMDVKRHGKTLTFIIGTARNF